MMKREEYLNELKSRLHGLADDEIQDALAYCEEYFNEAESDEKVIEDLGSPAKFAAQIKTEKAIKATQNPENYRKPKSMMKSFLIILGGLFALPIALPLLLVAIILFLVFGLVILIFALAGIVGTFACLYGAVATFFMTFFYAENVGDVLMHLGASLLFLGVALFIIKGVTFLVRTALPIFVSKTSEFYHRHKKGGRVNEAI